jgi:phospholipid/cholesterol/gamma-HCH transport system substrate-binding protein
MVNINSGKGTLGRLIQDSVIAENLSETMLNIKKSSKGLDENMEAAKHNFLLKGYFNKKEKEAAKLLEEEQKKADKKKKEDEKKNKEEQK